MGKKDHFCMTKGVGLPVVVVTPAVESLLGLKADPPPPSIYIAVGMTKHLKFQLFDP